MDVRVVVAAVTAACVAGCGAGERRAPEVVQAAAPTPSVSRSLADPGMPEQVLREYREEYPDVPVDVLYERLTLVYPQNLLLRDFAREPTFGGSWYDLRTGLWHLLGTDQRVLDRMAAQARAKGIDPAPRLVRYAGEQLHARATRIQSGDDPISRYSTKAGVDIQRNRVTVAADDPPEGVDDPMILWVPEED